MGDQRLTRRRLLRNGTAAVGAATLAQTSGCLDQIPVVGGGASYTDWLPEPGSLNSDSDHYRFTYVNMQDIEDNEDEFSAETMEAYEGIEDLWSPMRFDWDDASNVIFFQGTYVVNADYDREDAAGELDDEGYDDEDDYEGFTIYAHDDRNGGFALGDGTVIVISAFGSEVDVVDRSEEIIDTSNGDADRYVDDSDDMNELAGALGGGTIVRGRTRDEPDQDQPEEGIFDHMVGRGRTTTVNGDTSDVSYYVLYEDSDDVDLGELEDWVEANEDTDQQFDDHDDISYNQNGRLGVIQATMDTDEI